MNTAEYVDKRIQEMKMSGIPLSDAAWQAALDCVGWPYIYGDRGEYCTQSNRMAVYNKDPGVKARQNAREKCQAIRSSNPTGSCSGCKWYPGGKRTRGFDCRGFTYWILLQIYGWKLMGAGATSQWNNADNWTAKGTIDSIPEDQLVCLFVQKGTTMEHTGFGYHGETIECSSGVQHFTTRNAKWTHWGLPKCVSGDIPPAPEPGKKPTLRKGDKGPYVEELQGDLVQLGYDIGTYGPNKDGIDGSFGAKTEAAVKAFQKKSGLTADGIVGEKT